MGKKSKKKIKRNYILANQKTPQNELAATKFSSGIIPKIILVVLSLGVGAVLFVNKMFFFPYVGPKSLLLMASIEIAFFLFVFYLLKYKGSGIRFGSVIDIAFAAFLGILILACVFGVDPSRSFWSKFERMTGVLMWLHIFAFYLIVSRIFDYRLWQAFLKLFVIISLVVGLNSFWGGVTSRNGGTLGNSSFFGTFLMFGVFFGIWFYFHQKVSWKWLFVIVSIFNLFLIYLREARAAFFSTLGGIVLIFILYGAFAASFKKPLRYLFRVVLVAVLLGGVAGMVLLFRDGSFVQQKFIDMGGMARILNWQIAKQLIVERPVLGWGPENYTLVFTRYFNPCFFTSRCGGEIWFDRTHNIVFDTLLSAGFLGLASYLFLLFSLIYVLSKEFFIKKNIDFWTFSVFSVLVLAYFLQNLTVFDMPFSLLSFAMVLGFGSFVYKRDHSSHSVHLQIRPLFAKYQIKISLILIIAGMITMIFFVIRPFMVDRYVIKSLTETNLEKRLDDYRKTFSLSDMGQYQIREYLAQHTERLVKSAVESNPNNVLIRQKAVQELNLVISALEDSFKKSPLDYRIANRLAHLYQVYFLIDGSVLKSLEKYTKIAMQLSPYNQQSYWLFAQLMFFEGKINSGFWFLERAIDLEPDFLVSYKVALQAARVLGRPDEENKILQQALKIHPEWQSQLKVN